MSVSKIGQILLSVLVVSILTSCGGSEPAELRAKDEISVAAPDISGIKEEQFKDSAEILSRINSIFAIKPERAVEIGRKHLDVSPENEKSLILCDAGLGWQVVDPNKKREVWISKDSGDVYIAPVDLGRNVFDTDQGGPVNQIDAFEIAKKHFIAYGRKKFNSDGEIVKGFLPSVCDLDDSWRVDFVSDQLKTLKTPSDIGSLANVHPPDYIIDKKTGEITYFNFFRSN